MIRFKRVIAITLVFLMILTTLDLTILKKNNKVYAQSERYSLVVGYFEYWKDPNGSYMYDSSNGKRINMGKGNPNSYIVKNYTFPVATIGNNYKIKKLYNLVNFSGDWSELNYSALSENQVRNFYLDSAVIKNTSALEGSNSSEVTFNTSFYPLSTTSAKKVGNNKWRSYIAIVVEYEPVNQIKPPDIVEPNKPTDIVDPPDQPKKVEVKANIEIEAPNFITWNYSDFNKGRKEKVEVEVDCSGSTGAEEFKIDLDVGEQSDSYEGSRDCLSETFSFREDDVDLRNKEIKIKGYVEVMGEDGDIDTDSASDSIDVYFTNEAPSVSYTNPYKMYSTIPFKLEDKCKDFENEIKYKEWIIRDSSNNVVLNAKIFPNNPNYNTIDFLDKNFYSASVDDSGATLNVRKKDYYKVDLIAEDDADKYYSKLGVSSLSNTYSKILFINSEPQPPVADFEMNPFGFANEPISITDKSTDPNDDIVEWNWTKPNQSSGSLVGSGGSIAFKELGEYPFSLRVKDYTNLEDSITKKIKIIPPVPVAIIKESGTLKRNRKVNIHMRDSLSPKIDSIQKNRNEWTIIPLDGQNPEDIKIDIDTLNNEEKNIVFRDIGRYKVSLRVHNKFSDDNPKHENIEASYTEKIIDIKEDLKPIPEFDISGSTPNFFDNPTKTTVGIKGVAYSEDADIIDKYKYTVIRDNNENGDFLDDKIYGIYESKDLPGMNVYFEQGNSGKFKVIQEVKEEFGQPTIPKFVTSADRRSAKLEKIFDVNWRPDVVFDIPEWAYTDDTLNISTKLKDEEIDTLKVKWTIKRAKNGNKSILENAPLEDYTESVLDNNGGKIRFTKSGFYELMATVTDEVGQSYSFKDSIRIYPLPTAVIKDDLSFRKQPFVSKENRKYHLDGNSSFANDYYGNELHSIDHSKDYWEITSLDGQDAMKTIKIVGNSSDVDNPNKYSKSDDFFNEDLLFKQKGKYKVRYQVTNTFGKKSPFVEQIITIEEDTKPIIGFVTLDKIYRNPDDSNQAELISYNLSASSDDDDIIDIQEVKYRFDSNNDGNFQDETWSNPITIQNNKAKIKVNHVGKYQFQFYVKEKFGQDAIEQFVTDQDRKRDYKYKISEVDNMSPTVDFTVTPSNKVDIVFALGKVDSSKTEELNTKINTYVKSVLNANNIDNIDTQISMVDTVETTVLSGTFKVNIKWDGGGDMDSYMGFYDSSGDKLGEVSYNKKHWHGCSLDIDDRMGHNGEWLTLDFNSIPKTVATIKFWVHGYNTSGDVSVMLYKTIGDTTECVVNKTTYVSRKGTSDFGELRCMQDYWDFFGSGGEYVPGKIIQQKVEPLDQILNKPKWREDATRFIINISDEQLPELYDKNKYSVILSKMINDNLYLGELGTSDNKTQIENFIKDNDRKGTFIYNNNPSMDKALQDLGTWILSTVRNNKKAATKYLLVNSPIKYSVFYKDYENDPKIKNLNKWKYSHNSLYFKNSMGQVRYNNEWLYESKNIFDKVGKYEVEYKTRDNPVYSNDSFDTYRKWSTMLNGTMKLFVHRKPLANFKATINKNASNFNVSYVDNSCDLDHQGQKEGYYKLDKNDNIVTDKLGKYIKKDGIVKREWQWKEVGATTWNDGQFTSGKTTKEYLVRLRVKDMDGMNFDGVWSDWKVALITSNPQPPIAQFTLSHKIFPIESTLEVIDNTYDPNGDSIVQWEWKLYKEGSLVGIYSNPHSQSNINTTIKNSGIGNYKLTLQVRDNTGGWGDTRSTSDIFSQEFKVVPVNHAPGAYFNPEYTLNQQKSIKIYDEFVQDNLSGINWNSTYSDQDKDNKGFVLNWTLDRFVDNQGDSKDLSLVNSGILEGSKQFKGDIPFSGSFEKQNLKYGAYKVTFAVTDKPPVPPYQISDTLTTYVTKNIYVLPRLELSPSYKGDAINSKTIILKTTTNDHVNKVKVMFLGKEIRLHLKDQNGNTKYWEKKFTIPVDNSLFNKQTAIFRAYCNYNNMGDEYYIDKPLDINVKPQLTIKGDYKGEPITGETIDLIAETSNTAVNTTVEFMGSKLNMVQIPSSEISKYYSDISHDKKYWKVSYKISGDLTESKIYPAKFVAKDNYGQTATDIVDIYVIALRLINFRITNMVNHPEYSFPITKADMPIYYKAGYKVTYRINAIGNPISVKAKLFEDTSFRSEVNMVKVDANGNETIWEGTYYSSARLPEGSLIKINLKGYKGATIYDYNFREKWSDGGTLGSDVTGIILKVRNTALKDGRINRTN